MEGILNKLKKANINATKIKFSLVKSATSDAFEEKLDLINDEEPFFGSVKEISVLLQKTTEIKSVDDCIQGLINTIIGSDTEQTSFINKTKTVDKKIEDKPFIQKSVQTKNSLDGLSIPIPTSSNNSESSFGYKKPVPPLPNPPNKIDMEAPPPAVEEKPNGIRDVQMLAIQAMMKLRNINYEDLVTEAFKENKIEIGKDGIPSIEKLSEEQALEVIRYGNVKFKKQ